MLINDELWIYVNITTELGSLYMDVEDVMHLN